MHIQSTRLLPVTLLAFACFGLSAQAQPQSSSDAPLRASAKATQSALRKEEGHPVPIAVPLIGMPEVTREWHLFTMPASNMEPTIKFQDLLLFVPLPLAERPLIYRDIIAYEVAQGAGEKFSPSSSKLVFIMRVVGLAGDRIAIRSGQLMRNGDPVVEEYADLGGLPLATISIPETEIPSGMVYVLGDVRGNSNDSRFSGPISISRVFGIARYKGRLSTDSKTSQSWQSL